MRRESFFSRARYRLIADAGNTAACQVARYVFSSVSHFSSDQPSSGCTSFPNLRDLIEATALGEQTETHAPEEKVGERDDAFFARRVLELAPTRDAAPDVRRELRVRRDRARLGAVATEHANARRFVDRGRPLDAFLVWLEDARAGLETTEIGLGFGEDVPRHHREGGELAASDREEPVFAPDRVLAATPSTDLPCPCR